MKRFSNRMVRVRCTSKIEQRLRLIARKNYKARSEGVSFRSTNLKLARLPAPYAAA